MLRVSREDVSNLPFPHIVKSEILPSDLFNKLKEEFPTSDIFDGQYTKTGSLGSRVGAGTGFDIYRGDAAYDELIHRSKAWTAFDGYINSPAFIESFLEMFGDDLAALGCSVAVDPQAYDPQEVEARHVLRSKPTFASRLGTFLPKRKPAGRGAPKLFTRLDIERSFVGYSKPPHCDRENRLCSLIIYFTDTDAEGIVGGELNVYRHKSKSVPSDHERHPLPEDVEVVASVKPKPNLGIFFPCSNNSYHGVNAVQSQGKARDFLYINISTVSSSCW
jgi:hypothetical protein